MIIGIIMTKQNKNIGYYGNKNAVKENPRTSKIIIRVTPEEKARAVKNAGGKKLSDFGRDRLCF